MDKRFGGKVEGEKGGKSLLFCLLAEPLEAGLLLGFALGSHGRHGLLHGLLVTEERHGLHGLQVRIQLVHDWDSCGQVQLHDGRVGHTWKKKQTDQQTEQRECNGYSKRLSGAQLGRQEGQKAYIVKEVSRANVFTS